MAGALTFETPGKYISSFKLLFLHSKTNKLEAL